MVLTLTRLNRALDHVQGELIDLGFWSEEVAAVEVYLVAAGFAYAWKYDGGEGCMCFPAVSLSRYAERFGWPRVTLRDIVRHEYGHVVADTHGGYRTRAFTTVFGTTRGSAFDPDQFISPYAATQPAEDFAETFMHFVRLKGALPRKWKTPAIRPKWAFVEGLRA